MKKNDKDPATGSPKNETKNKYDRQTNNKVPNKNNDDLGTMKIGKAHSMNDDKAPVITKEERK